jgi:hypothetical protein
MYNILDLLGCASLLYDLMHNAQVICVQRQAEPFFSKLSFEQKKAKQERQ